MAYRSQFALPLTLLSLAATAVAQEAAVAKDTAAHEVEWVQEFAAAKATAAKEGKDLLVDFTGSDWCHWCKVLDKEVFGVASFQAAIVKDFVLVKLDFPNDKGLVTAQIAEQNEKLQATYGVTGYPTIFLMDAEGRPYAQTGYQEGGADSYLQHVGELRKAHAGRDEHFGKAKGVEGVDRARHLSSGLDALNNQELVLKHYRAEVDEIMKLDGDGKAGLKDKYEGAIALAEAEGKLEELAQEAKWDEIDKLMVDLLAKYKANVEVAQKATWYRAVTLLNSKQDFAGALKFIDEARAFAPDSDLGVRLGKMRKQIEDMAKGQGGAGQDEPKAGDDGKDGDGKAGDGKKDGGD